MATDDNPLRITVTPRSDDYAQVAQNVKGMFDDIPAGSTRGMFDDIPAQQATGAKGMFDDIPALQASPAEAGAGVTQPPPEAATPNIGGSPAGMQAAPPVAQPSVFDKLLGLNGAERYQTWPERMVRGAIDAPQQAMSGELGEPGSRDFSQAAIPGALDMASVAVLGGPPRVGGVGPAQAEAPPGLLRSAAQTAEKVFSPETVDANAKSAVATIRAATGQSARDTATTGAALEPYRARVNALDPEGKLSFIDYVEGRSDGKALAQSELQPVADALRTAFQQRRDTLESMPSADKMGFIEDYFPHMWKNPQAAQQFLNAGTKEGSGRFTKERTIPTIAEGIKAGLEPKYSDPIEATMAYVTNADRYIATAKVFENAKTSSDVKYFPAGKQPDGWMEVAGKMGRRGDGSVAYAPEGWARIYNNYVSRGFHDIDPALGDMVQGAQRASNAVTALELGLSGYHALTMAQEAMLNQFVRGIGNLRTGHPIEAAKDVLKTPIAPVMRAVKGRDVQNAYLGKEGASSQAKQIADLLTEGGGRAQGFRHSPDYEFSGKGSYVTAFKRGNLKSQLIGDMKDMAGHPIAGPLAFMGRQVGRFMDTVAQPLFEKYIPLLKNGAFYENMSAWLKQNPQATHEQQVNAARQFLDSVDNRFGEMVQDNVFWNKVIKQVAMLSLRSWSWTVGGDLREIGGGLRDFMRAPFKKPTGTGPNDRRWTQKMDYVIALPIIQGAISGVYQYLKTGQAPQDVRDLLAPRTGGVDANSDEPERLLVPGYMKDVYGAIEHPVQEATNKLATAPVKAWELLKNENWRGDPIRSPLGDDTLIQHAPQWLKDYWKYTTESFGPITVRNVLKGQKEGSNISMPEAALGVRTAPRQLIDPEGFHTMMDNIARRKWQNKMRFEARDKARYGGTE